jgi:hypothetical protein
MDTISRVLPGPGEFKARMEFGHFEPKFSRVPDSRKPLIYVTNPDNVENEIWVPPPHEDELHQMDEDSDDESCSCSEPLMTLTRTMRI